jgi:ribosome biogenesis GTPase / thiamine phosphate phosphatase
MKALECFGYDDWFKRHTDADKLAAHGIARVTAVHKDSYMITQGSADIFAELSGNLLYGADSAMDLPTTGDWVYADAYDENTHAIIYGVIPRKTLIKRKTVGKLVDFQLIAANIDTAFIVQSLNDNFNLARLERYLVMVNESGITPIILLSKCDLLPPPEVDEIVQRVRKTSPETAIMAFSNQNKGHIESIYKLLKTSLTYCLLGSSGVGKTSLLNSLMGQQKFDTQTVSNIQSKGRHTTTSRQLVQLENGALIVDTPGMRELGGLAVDDGLDETFAEITTLIQQCRFSDCSHTNEKGCAIVAALENGSLVPERYHNFQKMKKESDFNQMSYSEKRKKDKQFGKLIKTTIKNKRH